MSNAKQNEIEKYMGKKIGYLKVVGLSNQNNHFNSNHWDFECECGTVFSDNPSRILSEHRKSCGCKKGNPPVHNCYNSGLYHSWWSMVQRCYNSSNHNYARYGGRGITVCDEWRYSPVEFVKWVNNNGGKQKGFTLDRIDNNGNYEPSNCHWASMKAQSNNRSSNTFYQINGETKTFTQWCEYYNISDDVVWERIHKLKWDIEKAFVIPVGLSGKVGKQIEINGETKSIRKWCEFYGVSYSTASKRIAKGVNPKTAVSVKGSKGKPLL